MLYKLNQALTLEPPGSHIRTEALDLLSNGDLVTIYTYMYTNFYLKSQPILFPLISSSHPKAECNES